MAETYEQVLCVKHEVFVYKIAARVSNRGYRAAEWSLDLPDWTGRMKVVLKNNNLKLKLEDKNSGELFAECPVESYPSEAVEPVLDSSRYFVIRIRDESGRNAFIGIGFADRGDSFDLLVAIQDHFKHVKREEQHISDNLADAHDLNNPTASDRPKLDLSLKQGQTIKLNLATKKNADATNPTSRPRPALASGPILLPPPPGASRVVPLPHYTATLPHSTSNTTTTNTDLLLQLDPSPPQIAAMPPFTSSNQPSFPPINPFAADDAWEDFASAPTTKTSQKAPVNWVNFE